jgi:hypothetical protein
VEVSHEKSGGTVWLAAGKRLSRGARRRQKAKGGRPRRKTSSLDLDQTQKNPNEPDNRLAATSG